MKGWNSSKNTPLNQQILPHHHMKNGGNHHDDTAGTKIIRITESLVKDIKVCLHIGCEGTLPTENELLQAVLNQCSHPLASHNREEPSNKPCEEYKRTLTCRIKAEQSCKECKEHDAAIRKEEREKVLDTFDLELQEIKSRIESSAMGEPISEQNRGRIIGLLDARSKLKSLLPAG